MDIIPGDISRSQSVIEDWSLFEELKQKKTEIQEKYIDAVDRNEALKKQNDQLLAKIKELETKLAQVGNERDMYKKEQEN